MSVSVHAAVVKQKAQLFPPITFYAEDNLKPSLYLQGSKDKQDQQDRTLYRTSEQTDNGKPSSSDQNQSIHGMTTNEWRDAYEQEGCVDLWVEEEFNSGSRLMVSSAGCSCAAPLLWVKQLSLLQAQGKKTQAH